MYKRIWLVSLILALALSTSTTAFAAPPPPTDPSAPLVTDCGTYASVPYQDGKDIRYSGSVNCSSTQLQLSISIAIYGADGYWYGGQSRTNYSNRRTVSMSGVVNHYYVNIPAQKYRTQVCGWANNVALPCTYSGWSATYVP